MRSMVINEELLAVVLNCCQNIFSQQDARNYVSFAKMMYLLYYRRHYQRNGLQATKLSGTLAMETLTIPQEIGSRACGAT